MCEFSLVYEMEAKILANEDLELISGLYSNDIFDFKNDGLPYMIFSLIILG